MIYGATVWHSPKTSEKCTGPIAKLATLQNKCLRSITGAYKATNIEVLEAELGVVPFNIHLDQIVLKSRDNSKCVEVIRSAKTRIHKKLGGKRGRERQLGATPMSIKDRWAKESMDKLQKEIEAL